MSDNFNTQLKLMCKFYLLFVCYASVCVCVCDCAEKIVFFETSFVGIL